MFIIMYIGLGAGVLCLLIGLMTKDWAYAMLAFALCTIQLSAIGYRHQYIVLQAECDYSGPGEY